MKLLSLLVLGTFAAFANAAAVDNTLVERGCGGRKFYHPGLRITHLHEENFFIYKNSITEGDSCSEDSDCCEGKTCTREAFGYANKFCSR